MGDEAGLRARADRRARLIGISAAIGLAVTAVVYRQHYAAEVDADFGTAQDQWVGPGAMQVLLVAVAPVLAVVVNLVACSRTREQAPQPQARVLATSQVAAALGCYLVGVAVVPALVDNPGCTEECGFGAAMALLFYGSPGAALLLVALVLRMTVKLP